MSLFALALILTAALFHATWNVFAKRLGGGGTTVWLYSALSTALYAPFVAGLLLLQRPHIGYVGLLFMFGSGLLHLGYFVFLQRGYAVGDLSFVYPLARGTGPLLATLAAIVILGERPGAAALFGVVLICCGVFVIAGEPGGTGGVLGPGAVYGLLTGGFIAAYTLWDKQAVSALLVPPLAQSWGTTMVTTALLTPLAVRHREKVRTLWLEHRTAALGVAVLSPLSYILILSAMVFTPVSYIAPAREVSILIGTAMGSRLLAEGHTPRRLVAAAAIVTGIVVLAIG